MASGCASNQHEEAVSALYKNLDAEQTSHQSYDRAMELWTMAYEEEWVETEYGLTHLIISGPEEGSPLFLIPGLFADASMWFANAGAFAETYRVYAVDLPVFGGKSVPSKTPITGIADYRRWFETLLGHYGYESASAAGLSYGSWICLALAREIPEKIDALVLLDPSETFVKMRSAMMWKGLWYFMIFPSRGKYEKFFDWMGGGYSDPQVDIWFEHMLDVIEHGAVGMMDVPQHRIYGPEELTMLSMPILILVGGKPIIYKSPEQFKAAAEKALPNAEIEIIPGTGHSLNMEKAGEVNRRIMEFLSKSLPER